MNDQKIYVKEICKPLNSTDPYIWEITVDNQTRWAVFGFDRFRCWARSKAEAYEKAELIMKETASEFQSVAKIRGVKIKCLETGEIFGSLKDACIKYKCNSSTMSHAFGRPMKTAAGKLTFVRLA